MGIIVAGDTGGTKTYLGLYESTRGQLRPIRAQSFRTLDFTCLEHIVETFLNGEVVNAACFGLAGPVIDGRCEVTNIRWIVDTKSVAARLRIARVELLNDLIATAYGISELPEEEVFVLQQGRSLPGQAQALIAAGTGLGECGLHWNGQQYVPVAGEGGHADWAPHDDIHIELWRYLRAQLPEVGTERVVSGPGLVSCYCFLRDTRVHSEPDVLTKPNGEEAAAIITRHAEAGTSRLCQQALDIFLSAYGAEAGNLALRSMAVGGVYVGGGIAPKLLPHLGGSFLRAFREKYLLSHLMPDIPIKVILNDRTALLGAAHCAARL
jgi:glucokinase